MNSRNAICIEEPARRSGWFGGKVEWLDFGVVLLLALLAMAHHVGRTQGMKPFPFLGGDAANIAAIAAALDHPGSFVGDEVLGDQHNFRFYQTIEIPIIRALSRVYGDHGTAFMSLLGIHVFLQLLGFYVLGCTVFQNRFWALLLAFATLGYVPLNLGEYWGIYSDPQPRFLFQALLPFLLAAAFHWRARPRAWPWLLAAAGALIYVHPVSAPAWGAAIWTGLWLFQPREWPFVKRAYVMLLLGILFLAVTAPMVFRYISNHSAKLPAGVNYDEFHAILSGCFDPGFFDTTAAVGHFFARWESLYWIWAALGAWTVFRLRRDDAKRVGLVALWIPALLLVAMIPWFEQRLAHSRKVVPAGIDLMRNVRYLIPLMWVFCLWPFAEMNRAGPTRTLNKIRIGGLIALAILGVAIWSVWHKPGRINRGFSYLARPNADYRLRWQPVIEALDHIRRFTPPGSRILATDYSLQVRAYALRPVVFAEKDRNFLAYANPTGLIAWHERHQRWSTIQQNRDPSNKLKALVAFARSAGAQYLLIDFKVDFATIPSGDLTLVFTNSKLTLFAIGATGPSAAFGKHKDN